VNESEEEDIIEGTTVQLPTFAFTTVSTTVSVPDGGTILLGGIKRLAEGRSERGVPMLSKIPYVSRLFRNVSMGRDARSLMLMVTPRIIIQEEEELARTGFDPTR
jgi:general secretion pathway protein D